MKIPVKPFTLDSKAHLKVRYIFDRNEYDLQDALLDIVSGDKKYWTVAEWGVVINHIVNSDLTVGEYIKPYRK